MKVEGEEQISPADIPTGLADAFKILQILDTLEGHKLDNRVKIRGVMVYLKQFVPTTPPPTTTPPRAPIRCTDAAW